MRLIALLICGAFALTAIGQEPTVEIAGVAIERGMSQEQVRELLPAGSVTELGGFDDLEIWSVIASTWEDSGVVVFERGLVRRATDHVDGAGGSAVYGVFVLLNELLVQLTDGEPTCAMIQTHVPQEIFPQSDTRIVLPTKTISIMTAGSRDNDSGGVSLRVDLRPDPIPEWETVQRGAGQTGRCVLR